VSSPRRTLGASMLVLEALSVFFAALVAKDLSALGHGRSLILIGGLALGCLLTAGLLRWPTGYRIGSALQIVVLAVGFWVPAMFFVGAVFAALWAVALGVGAKIERERAAYVEPRSDSS